MDGCHEERGLLRLRRQLPDRCKGGHHSRRRSLPAIRQAEVGAARTMIERTERRFGLKPKLLAADTAYGSDRPKTSCSTFLLDESVDYL
jgi:hypothetical protein